VSTSNVWAITDPQEKVAAALKVCRESDYWVDIDPVELHRCAEILAYAYDELREEAKECCEVCQNSEWADECWRRNAGD
jgi:hypothetical protein